MGLRWGEGRCVFVCLCVGVGDAVVVVGMRSCSEAGCVGLGEVSDGRWGV